MNEYSWPREEAFLPYHMDHARILVCGENGVGKSTLINRVFGITVVHDRVVSAFHCYRLMLQLSLTCADSC